MLRFAAQLTGFAIIGLMMAWAIVASGSVYNFIDIPSMLFVLGMLIGGLLVATDPRCLIEAMVRAAIGNGGNDAVRHTRHVAALGKAQQFVWGAGILGFLVGLVVMLQNMSDPSSIGAGIAVGILPVIYGGFLAEFIFSPLQQALIDNPPRGEPASTAAALPAGSTTSRYGMIALFVIAAVLLIFSTRSASRPAERDFTAIELPQERQDETP